MLRVAIIGGKIHSGGKKNLIMEYYRHIDRTKVQFDFICDADSNAIPFEEIEKLGGRVYLVEPYEHIFNHIRDLWKICRENKYEVIHAYDSTMNLFPMAVAYFAGIKVRISESISMAHKSEFKTYIIKQFLRQFSRCFANYYMACGDDCGRWQFGEKTFKDSKIAIFKTAINSQANAYDPELRAEVRRRFEWEDKVIYGFIGRFEKQKNPLFLIEVFNEIRKRQDNAILAIIGSGAMEQQMQDLINTYNIIENVNFLGRREDIQQFYNAFDAFLLPSLYEGLPVVGLESQSAGLPIFFSSEVTPEASVCELGHFIGLDENPVTWAQKIIDVTNSNIQMRKSHADDVAKAGFDSITEALRLQEYYFNALKEQNEK